MKKQKKKIISFVNTKEVVHQNLNSLKRLVHNFMEFSKENDIHMVRHIEYSNKNDGVHVSAYLKESRSSHGFKFTLFHEEGLEVDSVHYRNHDFLPASCTTVTPIITSNKKGKIIHTKRFTDKAMQDLFEAMLNVYKAEASKF